MHFQCSAWGRNAAPAECNFRLGKTDADFIQISLKLQSVLKPQNIFFHGFYILSGFLNIREQLSCIHISGILKHDWINIKDNQIELK